MRIYCVEDGQVFDTPNEQFVVDCTALDASHYPDTALPGIGVYAGKRLVLQATLPAGATGWDDVALGDDDRLRALTADERATRDGSLQAAAMAAAWVAVRAERANRMQLGDVLEAKIWDGWRRGRYLAAQRDQLLGQVAIYRDTLRDIPEMYSDPAAVIWPTVPNLLAPYVPMEYISFLD